MSRFAVALLLCALAAGVRAGYSIETVAEGLEYPWSIAFLPDGSMLVTERAGRLRIVRDGELIDAPVDGVPDVYVAGQGGLFDVLPDPAFDSNRRLYLSFAHGDRKANATRVVAATFDGASLFDIDVLFTATPAKNTPHHYGGRMAFLPDGTLLVTTGDGFNFREQAQLTDNHLGKVVRIRTDGRAPADNPDFGDRDALPAIWTLGHRNPQGLVVIAQTGDVYLHEHGPRGGDELNRLEPGRNYGWPIATHGIDYSGARISPYREYPGTEQPLAVWTPSIAPAGMTHYTGTLFADWRGDLFIAALAEKSVRRVRLDGDKVVVDETLFTELGERLRDVAAGPDGALYLLTDSANGRILKVLPD